MREPAICMWHKGLRNCSKVIKTLKDDWTVTLHSRFYFSSKKKSHYDDRVLMTQKSLDSNVT